MAQDVFICHSSIDKGIAAAVRDRFENSGISCWMAPRDVLPGQLYAQAIVDAIDVSKMMLIVISANANKSTHVINELERAVKKCVPILPVKVDDAELSGALDYYLGKTHWFDAAGKPIHSYLEGLTKDVGRLMAGKPMSDEAVDSERVDLKELQIDAVQVVEFDEQPAYEVTVSRTKPACILLLVDMSFSMNHRIAGTDLRKKDAVAETVNNLLYNAILISTKGDGVRHYFDIGIIGYGVGDGVENALDRDLVAVTELADNPKRWTTRKWEEGDGRGGMIAQEEEMPIWFEPRAKGKTLMKQGFDKALAIVRVWTAEHPDSFPPIVLNITDGDIAEGDPTPVVRELQEQSTSVGATLVFNCHLSEREGETLMFPSPAVAANFDKRMRQLHDMSSELPEPMRQQAVAFDYPVESGARGYVLNADLTSLVDFLDIGTRGVTDIVEEV